LEEEKSPVSREVIRQIVREMQILQRMRRDLYGQDTGLAVFFVKVG